MSLTPIQLNETSLHGFYSSYFRYYNTLSHVYKKRFVNRCLQFTESKNITGADGFEITNHVKAIVAASAVQLTLGLDTWDYDYFMEIIIHPKTFINENSGQLHKGETNLGGYIKFSWPSFIKGYQNNQDNLNLGIHEFSHALRFNSIRGNEEDYFIRYFFNRWLYSAYEAFNDLNAGRATVFRAYGGTNMNEFISVCFEHYFESPLQIKERYPVLFYNTAILLNQLTVNEQTEINVRERLMAEKNQTMKEINAIELKQTIATNSEMHPVYISGAIWLTTVLATGLISAPSLFLLLLTILFFVRFDYRYVRLRAAGTLISITKGFWLFKRISAHNVMLSQIVQVNQTKGNKNSDLSVLYFNFGDKHFYEEHFECDSSHAHTLVAGLKANKIAVVLK